LKTIIIHGHTNQGFRLSEDSIDRCLVAIDFFNKKKVNRIICTGGLFNYKQKGISNSCALKNWLINKNIPAEIIIKENKSLTTIDNVERVSLLLKPEETIYVISSNYHYLRIKIIWKLISKKRAVILLAKSKITFKKLIIEIIGLLVVFFWSFGFRFPELFVRKKFRNVNC